MPITDALPAAPPAEVRHVSQFQADKALEGLRSRQHGTPFLGAKPSTVPGLVTVQLPDGKVAYTDISGRFYIVGVVFDLNTGQALDGALDGRPSGN